MTQRFISACVLVSACAWSASAAAQDGGAPANRLLRTLSWTEAKVDGISGGAADGFYPEFGGLITGAGIAAGPGYRQQLFGRRMIIDASGAISMRRYTQLQSRIEWPRLMNDRLSLGAQLRVNDFTEINYFGVGRDSTKNNQTDYRLKYIDTTAFGTVHAASWLSIAGRAGLMRRAGITSGTSTLVPSVEERFTDASAPGLIAQPNYAHADVSIEADTRDVPGYPASGGRYRASFAAFHDRDFGRYSFRRVETEASQYIPLGERTVASLRGRLDLTQTADGQQVPFYLMPALGSGQTLRGYDDYRFRDRDAALANAELRTRVAGPLDAVVFFDAGSVAPTFAALTEHRALTDYGVGVRVHSKRHLLVRLDLARGSEGTHAIVSFTPSFAFAKRTVAPYVP
jgi:outer membrane protein assembly factor BamA